MSASPYQLFNPEALPLPNQARFEFDLLQLVIQVRDAQKDYFKCRTGSNLNRSLRLEKQLQDRISRHQELRPRIEAAGTAADWYFQLIEEVAYMRATQKAYFKNRIQAHLINARVAEGKVDALITKILTP